MKKLLAALLIATMMLSLGCGSKLAEKAERVPDSKTIELHVAAAASLTDAMKELAKAYKAEHPEITLTFNFGSSGALQQAIENGGETDLFFSAAQKQMDTLEKSGNLAEDTRRDLLENSVVLVVPVDSSLDLKSFADLTKAELKHIALGEPKGVPVGQYAEEILTQLAILEQVKEKAVYGSDVRQVLAWVAAGEADCGVVYATDATIDAKVKVVSKAPEGSHKPVIYPAAVIKSTKHLEEAKDFLDFAGSSQGKKVFEKYGFICK